LIALSNISFRIFAAVFDAQHHKSMSIAPSRTSTVTDQEFEDTYSTARTKLDDKWDAALSSLISYAKKQATLDESQSGLESALRQPVVTEVQLAVSEGQPDEAEDAKAEFELAKAKAEAAYPYSELPMVLYMFVGDVNPCSGPYRHTESAERTSMEEYLRELNEGVDPEIRLSVRDLSRLTTACSQAGVAHPGETRRQLYMWNAKVFRAFCKLRLMARASGLRE
jgi:hypothetical protein